MIKPGSRDVKLHILIAGAELDELQRFTWMMVEAFGLDRRIDRYRGKRPIGLWRWDVECLLEVMHSALADPREYRSQEEPGYLVLKGLRDRLQQAYDGAYSE
jgi:hypothetical protein